MYDRVKKWTGDKSEFIKCGNGWDVSTYLGNPNCKNS